MEEISINQMQGIRIGNAQDFKAKTGVTVLIFPQGASAGVDISGGCPASRETPVLLPTTAATPVHAIVLSGGSAYGLAASTGVMRYLEEHGMGYDTGFALVPIVCQSSLYDLSYGSATVRPDAAMGYAACCDAMENNKPKNGSWGAGTGATVGKICGMERSMKSGLGIYAVRIGGLQVAAVVAVNAFGDIFDTGTGMKLAGLMNAGRTGFADTKEELYKIKVPQDMFHKNNTTIGAIITNGKFTKSELTKLASMTRNAYARCINPVGTLADGDTIYAASCGETMADMNMTGTLAADVMAEAIKRAVLTAQMADNDYLPDCLGLKEQTVSQTDVS
jgi:L-aminopeptidase/D-esterase-like protein